MAHVQHAETTFRPFDAPSLREDRRDVSRRFATDSGFMRPAPASHAIYTRICFTSSYASIIRLRNDWSMRNALSAFCVASITPSTSDR